MDDLRNNQGTVKLINSFETEYTEIPQGAREISFYDVEGNFVARKKIAGLKIFKIPTRFKSQGKMLLKFN